MRGSQENSKFLKLVISSFTYLFTSLCESGSATSWIASFFPVKKNNKKIPSPKVCKFTLCYSVFFFFNVFKLPLRSGVYRGLADKNCPRYSRTHFMSVDI